MSKRYIDVRRELADYERKICPECGTEEWFKQLEKKRWRTDQWNCENCGSYYEDLLEYPCPECDIRMVLDGPTFMCRNEDCPVVDIDIDREGLIDRLSSDDYMVRGMPGVWVGECPVCNEDGAINGGPDGELECRENNDFYAGRYSDVWFCYAIWLEDEDKIRVNEI